MLKVIITRKDLKSEIPYLIFIIDFDFSSIRGANVQAETTSSQTEIMITIKDAPPVVPTPNQIIPTTSTTPPTPPIRGEPLQGLLPRTNDQDSPIWEAGLGLICLLMASLLLKLNLLKKKKEMNK